MNRFGTWKLVGLAIVGLFGANASAQCIKTADASGVHCVELLAGQTTTAGSVCLEVQGGNLVATFSTTGGWELVETHLWAGKLMADLPQTRKGSPIPGQFPYKSGALNGATEYTSVLPLTALNVVCPGDDSLLTVAAHASVRKLRGDGSYQSETGWGAGRPLLDKGGWATAFELAISCTCEDTPIESTCETAWAHGATCFLDIAQSDEGSGTLTTQGKGDANRWGWTAGPFSEGTQVLPLWAAAGKCDTTKGVQVGTLTIVYSGGVAVATYQVTAPYVLSVAQLYVGNDLLPRVDGEYTVAPGQLGANSGSISTQTYTFTVEGLSGLIYVAAHANVCGIPK